MTDVNDPANLGTTLAPMQGSDGAKGIAIEIMDGLNPVTLDPMLTSGNQREFGSIAKAGGSFIKRMSARYKRTNTVVTPGPLSADVTISLIYD